MLPSNDKSELLQHFLPDTIVCPSLKSAVCKKFTYVRILTTSDTVVGFVLEIRWERLPLRSLRAIDDVRTYYREMIKKDRLEAEGWDIEGQALGLW